MDFQIKPHYFFGAQAVKDLNKIFLHKKPKKVLLLFGANSAKKNGAYDDVVELLEDNKINFIEFWGIEPNPRISTCEKAIALGIKEKIDLVIAIGGGSVIDAAKVIAYLINNNDMYPKAWDYLIYQNTNGNKPIPIYAILTIAGTASENNSGSVISNEETQEKRAIHNAKCVPEVCVLDPKYTFTISKWHLASAGFDCLAHLLEQYLGNQPSFGWREEYLFANMRTIIKNLPLALNDPHNFDAKANIMFAASFSLNPLASISPEYVGATSDWRVHSLEHALSGLYDITHGAGLALIYPIYLKIQKRLGSKGFVTNFTKLSQIVFGVDSYDAGVHWLENFIHQIGLLKQLKDFKISKEIEVTKDCAFCLKHFLEDYELNPKDLEYGKYKELATAVFTNIIVE